MNLPTRTTAVVLALMAACAGVVDLWAITSLGGAFAGVVTGNLVTVGRAVGEARPAALWAPAVAVAGFAVGVAVWSGLWRRRRRSAVLVPLVAELGLLVVVAIVWPLTGTRPGEVVSLALLAAASIAMGGQSSIALRLGESTTYLTGTLTGAVAALVGDGEGRVSALRQLAALVAGAALAAVLLEHLRWSVPVLAVILLAASVAVRAWSNRRGSGQQRHQGEEKARDDGGPDERAE